MVTTSQVRGQIPSNTGPTAPKMLPKTTHGPVTHTANRMQLKILELDLETIDHPPFSPDLTPTDYHLLQNLDNFLQGKIFNSQQAVENAFRAFIGSCSPGFYLILSILFKEQ